MMNEKINTLELLQTPPAEPTDLVEHDSQPKERATYPWSGDYYAALVPVELVEQAVSGLEGDARQQALDTIQNAINLAALEGVFQVAVQHGVDPRTPDLHELFQAHPDAKAELVARIHTAVKNFISEEPAKSEAEATVV